MRFGVGASRLENCTSLRRCRGLDSSDKTARNKCSEDAVFLCLIDVLWCPLIKKKKLSFTGQAVDECIDGFVGLVQWSRNLFAWWYCRKTNRQEWVRVCKRVLRGEFEG